MRYCGKYKRPGIFGRWVKFNNVTGDGFLQESPTRFFELEDGALVHFPSSYEVIFDKCRKTAVLENMSKESGQQVQGA